MSFVVMQFAVSNANLPAGTDYVTALTRYLAFGSGVLVLAVAGLTLIGSMLRAAAHGWSKEDRTGLDFAGKLFAVSAATLSVAIALYSAPWFPSVWQWITGFAGALALIVFGVVLIRRGARRQDERQL